MPRNMSFALTTEQIRNRTKTVTRRVGWGKLVPGDTVNACVKCMGLKKGEKPEKLALIYITSVAKEPLHRLMSDAEYGAAEATKEGFPGWTGRQFVEMFCEHMNPIHGVATEVNRIEFEYVEEQKQ
jgi:hypothetical protein